MLEFLSIMKNELDVIAISETWYNDWSTNVNSLYQIRNHIPIHRILKSGNKSGGLALLIHKTITFETLEKLSNNKKHIENVFEEMIQKIIILRCIYRPPRGNHNIFTCKAKVLIGRYKQNQKSLVFVGI